MVKFLVPFISPETSLTFIAHESSLWLKNKKIVPTSLATIVYSINDRGQFAKIPLFFLFFEVFYGFCPLAALINSPFASRVEIG